MARSTGLEGTDGITGEVDTGGGAAVGVLPCGAGSELAAREAFRRFKREATEPTSSDVSFEEFGRERLLRAGTGDLMVGFIVLSRSEEAVG